MKQPGLRLRVFAARFCNASTMERLIDPVIADLHAEYADAIRRVSRWKARWALIAGYVAFSKVLSLAGLGWLTIRPRTVADTDWHRRASVAFLATTVLSTIILVLGGSHRALNARASQTLLAVYLIPSTLPFSLAFGATFGVVLGLGRERFTRRLLIAVLAAALACSVVMLVNTLWVVPESNQAYREEFMGRPVARGDRESSLSELRKRVALRPDDARRLEIVYQTRWSYSVAPLTLALLALAFVHARRASRLGGVLGASAICVGYWLVLIAAAKGGTLTMLPVKLIAWSPNLACALLTAVLIWRADTAASRLYD